MAARLLRTIDTKNFGAETIRLGDFNGDGDYELLFVQNYRSNREISCLTVTDMDGHILWQTGTPSVDNGHIYSDLPVQVYDWDEDGKLEVLWIEQATYVEPIVSSRITKQDQPMRLSREQIREGLDFVVEIANVYAGNAIMHVLDAATGREKQTFPLPAAADDCFAFANLTGGPRRQDLIVKDRYWNMWGIAHDGTTLWHWKGETGHFPGIFDFDGDGMDEVFVGCALIDHDGKELWRVDDFQGHQDAACMVTSNNETRFVAIADKLRCHDMTGNELWSADFGHGQHVIPGCYSSDAQAVQFAVLDEGEGKMGGESLSLLDWNGNLLWKRALDNRFNSSHMTGVRWYGNIDCIAVFSEKPNVPTCIFDGHGNLVDELYFVLHDGTTPASCSYAITADIWGDSREEVFLISEQGVTIYSNSDLNPSAKLFNATYYKGF